MLIISCSVTRCNSNLAVGVLVKYDLKLFLPKVSILDAKSGPILLKYILNLSAIIFLSET